MGYWFDKKNTKEKCTKPYTPHWNLDNIKYARVEEENQESVIIVNLKNDILGIPSKIKNNKILNYVLEGDVVAQGHGALGKLQRAAGDRHGLAVGRPSGFVGRVMENLLAREGLSGMNFNSNSTTEKQDSGEITLEL